MLTGIDFEGTWLRGPLRFGLNTRLLAWGLWGIFFSDALGLIGRCGATGADTIESPFFKQCLDESR